MESRVSISLWQKNKRPHNLACFTFRYTIFAPSADTYAPGYSLIIEYVIRLPQPSIDSDPTINTLIATIIFVLPPLTLHSSIPYIYR